MPRKTKLIRSASHVVLQKFHLVKRGTNGCVIYNKPKKSRGESSREARP